jgi:hypothetical protein
MLLLQKSHCSSAGLVVRPSGTVLVGTKRPNIQDDMVSSNLTEGLVVSSSTDSRSGRYATHKSVLFLLLLLVLGDLPQKYKALLSEKVKTGVRCSSGFIARYLDVGRSALSTKLV